MKKLYLLLIAVVLSCSSALAQHVNSYSVEYQETNIDKFMRITVGGGYSFRLGKPEDENAKKLRNGWNVSADMHYVKGSIGFGLNFNRNNYSASFDNVYISGYGVANNVKEKQNIMFVGPSYTVINGGEKSFFCSIVCFRTSLL